MTSRLTIALSLFAVACGSKHDDKDKQGSAAPAPAPAPAPTPAPTPAPAPAPAPTPPAARPDGLLITDQGLGKLVVDTVSGYQIEFPSEPTVKDKQLDAGQSMITLVAPVGNSALVVNFIRVAHIEQSATELDNLFEVGFKSLVDDGYKQVEDVKVTFGGQPGRRFIGKKVVGGTPMTMHAWQMKTPAHDTMIQLNTLVPDDEAPDPVIEHFSDTLVPVKG